MRVRAVALLAAAGLLAAATGLPAPADSGGRPTLARLAGGASVEVWPDGHVLERSRAGAVLEESWCGSASRYARWVAFLGAFRRAVAGGDRAAVASAFAYPLRWNGAPGGSVLVRSRAQLLRDYGAVFTRALAAAVAAADPRALFCKDVSEVALGAGLLWGDQVGRRGAPALVAINAP